MDRPLSNHDIIRFAKEMNIPHFRGVFMRDNLPRRCRKKECLVLNHDSIKNSGTHWTSLIKVNKTVYYFDSFGKLPPPVELIKYLGKGVQINYNYHRYQDFDTVICGQLCLKFLNNFWRDIKGKII